jgi:hypothetical protein
VSEFIVLGVRCNVGGGAVALDRFALEIAKELLGTAGLDFLVAKAEKVKHPESWRR